MKQSLLTIGHLWDQWITEVATMVKYIYLREVTKENDCYTEANQTKYLVSSNQTFGRIWTI